MLAVVQIKICIFSQIGKVDKSKVKFGDYCWCYSDVY